MFSRAPRLIGTDAGATVFSPNAESARSAPPVNPFPHPRAITTLARFPSITKLVPNQPDAIRRRGTLRNRWDPCENSCSVRRTHDIIHLLSTELKERRYVRYALRTQSAQSSDDWRASGLPAFRPSSLGQPSKQNSANIADVCLLKWAQCGVYFQIYEAEYIPTIYSSWN